MESSKPRKNFATGGGIGLLLTFFFIDILRRSRRISHARKEEILRLRLRMTRNTPTGWLAMTDELAMT